MQRLKVVALLAGGDDQPAVKVKVLSPVARAAGGADVALILDAKSWARQPEKGRLAMLDHGLASLAPVIKAGSLSTDPAGRPRLKKRRPDLVLVGHSEVLARYGAASPEAEALGRVRAATQSVFHWG